MGGTSTVVDRELPSDCEQPPYPFKSGESLLNLTRVHNVKFILSVFLRPCQGAYSVSSRNQHYLIIGAHSYSPALGLCLRVI